MTREGHEKSLPAKGGLWSAVSGAEGQDRTVDTTIFSRVLYQLSYLGTRRSVSAAQKAGKRTDTGEDCR